MRLVCFLAIVFCVFQFHGFAAPVPKPKPGPKVVDFSPLIGCAKFSIFLTAHFEKGTKIENLETEVDGPVDTPESILLCLQASLGDHFDIEVLGNSQLVIKGFKGKGVLKVEVKTPTLPKANQPTVRPWKGK